MTRKDRSHGWDASIDGVCALPLRVVAPIDWRLVDDGEVVRIHMGELGQDQRFKGRVAPVLEGLEAGEDLPQITTRLQKAQPDWSRERAGRHARRLVGRLVAQGNVEIDYPPIPEAFAGRYKVVRELGKGGIGVVWLCEDLEASDRPVVVKHAWNWVGPLAPRDKVIRAEAQVVKALDHPKIVRFVDHFELEGRAHLVRDYVDGEELSNRFLVGAPDQLPKRAQILHDVAEILEHMHASGALMLDVTPANFMLTEETGTLVASDLSHARFQDDGRVELGGKWGSRGYAAPEVLGKPHTATAKSDLYGLGRLLAFLVLGRSPRSSEAGEEFLAKLEQAGALTKELSFVEACTQEQAEDRPESLGAALRILGEP